MFSLPLGLEGLRKKIESGLAVSQNLKDTVKQLGARLQKSEGIEDSISIVSLLISGLTK